MNTPGDPRQIDLTKAEDFVLGFLRVSPPTLQVDSAGRSETLEPRIMQVFVALNRRRGEVVSREDLISLCWDGRSVGDDAINRCIARLRRLAEAEGGFVIETVPRVGYRLRESGAGIPTAEAYLDTAEAGADAAPITGPEQAPLPAPPAEPWWWSRRAVLTAAVFLIVLTGAVSWFAWPSPPLNRVAVLPLAPIANDEEARVFGVAVAEQIVGVLNENQVQAISRDQIDSLRGKGRDKAARRLGVDFILDGKVLKTVRGLKVTVHLDRASSHVTLWSETFEQPAAQTAADSAGLQSQVAARVVDEIKAALQAAGLKNDAAVAAYLKTKQYGREGGKTATALRRDQYRIVVAREPGFSLGHSGLAWSTAALAQFAEPSQIEALHQEARKEAERALDLDPGNGEAYLALAALVPPRDYAGQEREFRKGLSVQPDEPTLNSTLAALLEDTGRFADALPLYERAVMLDPLSPRKNAGLAGNQAVTGNMAQARATIAHARKMWPDNSNVWGAEVNITSFSNIAKARAFLQEGRRPSWMLEADLFTALEAMFDAIAENTPKNRAAARQAILSAVANRHLDEPFAVSVLARIGEIDGAFAVSELAFFNNRSGKRPNAAVMFVPGGAAMRRDPRFLPLVTRLGLMKYWQENTPPDFCQTEAVEVCRVLKRGAANRPR